MPDEMNFDFTELTQLAADLGKVAAGADPFIRQALQVTSGNVKDAALKSVEDNDPSGRWTGAKGAIDYELSAFEGFGASVLKSEIGYNVERYGDKARLGNLREYGAPGADGVPLAPHNDLLNALHSNEADFVKGLSIALKDAEKAAGL